MYPYKYKISIRIEHPSLNLINFSQQVRKLLGGIEIGKVNTAGNDMISKTGKKTGSRYSKSSFRFSFSAETQDSQIQSLDQAIAETLVKLEPCRDLFHDLAQKGVSIIFFVGVFIDSNSGITFDSALIHQLNKFNIEIQLDIYPSDLEGVKKIV